MPASQLKRLKSSLREQGITGQQKSKKQKIAHKTRPTSEKVERSAALQQIRDSFNPFELRQPSRPAKFATASTKAAANGRAARYKDVLHRPGVTKGAGEEMRRSTLLPEMQRRNKTGGFVDRRIGEGDVDMTPEEKAAQRYARAQSKRKGTDLFNLEASDDDDLPGTGLTHGGKSITDLATDDFGEAMSDSSDGDGELLTKKRKRTDEGLAAVAELKPDESAQPDRKKSRKEVMEEVIAKSKFHKYERQKVKEDDDDLREELDRDTTDVLALLYGDTGKPASLAVPPAAVGPQINPDRQRLLDGADRRKVDKEYDTRLRQFAQDTRAKPTERTKTEEEKAADESKRLKELEESRARRMRGEDVDDEEDGKGNGPEADQDTFDEAEAFGLQGMSNDTQQAQNDKILHDDEDDFALDEDLIASDADESAVSSSEGSDEKSADDEDDEFVRGIIDDTTKLHMVDFTGNSSRDVTCPRTHAELLKLVADLPVAELPTVIQRIRALHDSSLSAINKEALADFSAVLVDHISYMAAYEGPLDTVEQVIRHVHSMSRTYPTEVAVAFRRHLTTMHKSKQPTAGDLAILTAIGSIYPTSDHFHQVVTPAMTLIARYLGLEAPTNSQAHSTGAFLVRLALHYQRLSRRYVPEAIRFTLKALSSSAVNHSSTHLLNLIAMAELWRDKSAFSQIFTPFLAVLSSLSARKELQMLQILLASARQRCRPLELHHHRPLPIRSSVPKFEEGFNPDKHYDPDKDRSEARKLQKEYKRERKGALRELRKDANFMAREQLREKKERDVAYEKKYKRLIAEIQGEEGHEANAYEREKKARKRSRR